MTDKMPQTLQDADVMRIAAKLVKSPRSSIQGSWLFVRRYRHKKSPPLLPQNASFNYHTRPVRGYIQYNVAPTRKQEVFTCFLK